MKIAYGRLQAMPRIAAVTALFLSLTLLLFGFAANAEAKDLTLKNVKPDAIESGTYSVIGYGCNSASDVPALAILKKEGTPYNLDLKTPVPAFSWADLPTDRNYKMITGLSADDALKQADAFANCNPEARNVAMRSISAADGTLIGYEVRPVYSPLRYGSAGLLNTSYSLKQDTLIANVRMDPLATMNEWGPG